MATRTKAPKPAIKAASIAKVFDRQSKALLGWYVKSNTSNRYYGVSFFLIDDEPVYLCECEAKDFGCSECCHVKAIKQVEAARKELESAQEIMVQEMIASAERTIEEKCLAFEAVKAEIKAIEQKHQPVKAFQNKPYDRNKASLNNAGVRVPLATPWGTIPF